MTGILTEPLLSAVPLIVGELRADTDVATLVGRDTENIVRVRVGEPKGAVGQYPGDARGPGQYQQFIVVDALDEPPHPSLPIFRFVLGFRCYGATRQGASYVYGTAVKALHGVRARLKQNGQGIYITAVETGGQQDTDPRTGQPHVLGTIRGWATAGDITQGS